MPRYIDADAFECISWKGIPEGYDDTFDSGVLYVADLIYDQPTVSPDEVRGGGQWKSKTMTVPGGHGQTYNRWGCSKCKARFKTRTNYCPSCGAKMEVTSDGVL